MARFRRVLDDPIAIEYELPGDDDIKEMTAFAQSLPSFKRFHVTELGRMAKQNGAWFDIRFWFTDIKDRNWFRLRWG
jgi:hypothetical protein